jgi:hypothetical protein
VSAPHAPPAKIARVSQQSVDGAPYAPFGLQKARQLPFVQQLEIQPFHPRLELLRKAKIGCILLIEFD